MSFVEAFGNCRWVTYDDVEKITIADIFVDILTITLVGNPSISNERYIVLCQFDGFGRYIHRYYLYRTTFKCID